MNFSENQQNVVSLNKRHENENPCQHIRNTVILTVYFTNKKSSHHISSTVQVMGYSLRSKGLSHPRGQQNEHSHNES